MKMLCACLAICLSLPVFSRIPAGLAHAAAEAGGSPAPAAQAPVSPAAPGKTADAATAPQSPAQAAPAAPATTTAPTAAPAGGATKTAGPAPIALGPFTLQPKEFGQKADTVTISGEISGGKPCQQLTVDFSLHNTVRPQDVIMRETIEQYDPQTPSPFERSAAAQNDVKAWKSWQIAYITLQCINNGVTARHVAKP